MSLGYCSYIDGDCDWSNDALKCAKVSAVACRAKREKLLEQKGGGKDEAKMDGDCRR